MTQQLSGACVIAQSGGPTAVINASAYGVIRTALDSPQITAVYGAEYGILGVLNEALFDLSQEDAAELEMLLYTPSSELGSCRYKLADPARDQKDYRRILAVLQKYNIRYFFLNGGNDSMDTCHKVSNFLDEAGYECRVIGIPKTIDNDLCGTDHAPGYGSAAKYIATTTAEVQKDAYVYDVGTVVILEIMGRDAGWLTGAAALASLSGAPPDLIYLPEVPFEMERFLAEVTAIYQQKGKCLVAVSEGIKYADGQYVSEGKASASDGFGHAMLGGLAYNLAEEVREACGAKVRGIELSLLQRCSAHLAAKTDVDEAFSAGVFAVQQALAGATGKMVSLQRDENTESYRCRMVLEDLALAANLVKKVPPEWICQEGNFVTPEFYDYVLPLIQGENPRPVQDGLPRFAKLKKIRVNLSQT